VFLVFGEMKARGLRPDRAAYNALLEACARAGAANRCFDVLRDMVRREGHRCFDVLRDI
jgi:pentatricopeptide repeat protein